MASQKSRQDTKADLTSFAGLLFISLSVRYRPTGQLSLARGHRTAAKMAAADARQRANGSTYVRLWLGVLDDDQHRRREQEADNDGQDQKEVDGYDSLDKQQYEDGQDHRLHDSRQQDSLFPLHDTMYAIVLEMLFLIITALRVVLLHARCFLLQPAT